jgi:hypothetical protein
VNIAFHGVTIIHLSKTVLLLLVISIASLAVSFDIIQLARILQTVYNSQQTIKIARLSDGSKDTVHFRDMLLMRLIALTAHDE